MKIMIMKFICMFFNMFLISYSIIINSIHPINLLFIMIFYTINSSLLIYLFINHSIYSFMIFISIIGGVMIMMIYFISLINNENSKISTFNMIFLLIMFFIFIMNFIYIIKFTPYFFLNNSSYLKLWNFKITKIYDYPLFFLSIFMIWYLLFILFISFKISTIKMKPLRKMK